MSGVVILSASNYSLYSIMVAEGILEKGIPIDRIVIKKLFNSRRLLSEVKAGPVRFIRKLGAKLIFRKAKSNVNLRSSIAQKFLDGGFKANSLTELAANAGIPITFCDDFHSKHVLANIIASKPTLVAFTGGGIVRGPLLEIASKGVINCHMGILPAYRGMDCYVWAILNGHIDKIGLTTHFMDLGIDTGPIIERLHLSLAGLSSIGAVEAALEANMPKLMIRAISMVFDDTHNKETQRNSDGRQYYVPVDRLREHAEYKLSKICRPNYDR